MPFPFVVPFIVRLKFRIGVEGIDMEEVANPDSRIPGISSCGGDNNKDGWNDTPLLLSLPPLPVVVAVVL